MHKINIFKKEIKPENPFNQLHMNYALGLTQNLVNFDFFLNILKVQPLFLNIIIFSGVISDIISAMGRNKPSNKLSNKNNDIIFLKEIFFFKT